MDLNLENFLQNFSWLGFQHLGFLNFQNFIFGKFFLVLGKIT